MPKAIPSILLPYVRSLPETALTLVTSTLDASPNWLVVCLIDAALNGVETGDVESPGLLPAPGERVAAQSKVIFVSLLQPLGLWTELGQKMGLNFATLIANGRVKYIDGLGVPGNLSSNKNIYFPKQLDLESVVLVVDEVLKSEGFALPKSTTTDLQQPSAASTTLVIDGLDLLLATQPNLSPIDLVQRLNRLRSNVHSTILTCSADAPLLHNSNDAVTPLEVKHRAFATSVSHQSRWIMQVRSLDTGAAKDISGVLRISRGGGIDDTEEDLDVQDGEWLYQVKGDGSFKIWTRGE